MKRAGITTQKKNVVVNSTTVDMVEMITTSLTNSLVLHVANSSKQRQQHSVHVHEKNNQDHNNLEVSNRIPVSWIMTLVNVVYLRRDSITTRMRDFVTFLHMAVVEEMKIISNLRKNVNNIAVMFKIFVVCHRYMEVVKKM